MPFLRQPLVKKLLRMSAVLSSADKLALCVDIGYMREKYKSETEVFTEKDIECKEPIGLFKLWFDEAVKNPAIFEANTMCLATATKDGIPSARYVLLKGYGKDGFKFFTNFESKKGENLNENPRAALVFYWEVFHRQVRIEGNVKRLSDEEADSYFDSRPKESQLGAAASRQSRVIAGRDTLIEQVRKLSEEYPGECSISRPSYWGGYMVVPEGVEFWQGQTNRLHDRIRFRRPHPGEEVDGVLVHAGDKGWVYERLSP